ncbi:MAG: helix-turn-helix domain-containing protein [Clostridia bacterium]|nr:helix-turn-helix domain-containing protein [Clostridia bacterium]
MAKRLSTPQLARITGLYSLFERELSSDYIFRGETHDYHEVIMLLDGSLAFTAGESTYEMCAPAAIYHPRMEFHSLRNVGRRTARILIFSFDADLLPDYPKHRFAITEEDIARARRALALIQSSTVETDFYKMGNILPGGERAVQQGICELEILLLSLRQGHAKSHDHSAGATNYKRALRAIEEHLSGTISIASLSEQLHISPSLLKKIFARYAGMGVMQYVRTRKMNEAILRLREGRSVGEVAYSLGYEDPAYFSTVFRRVTGHSPSYFRERP